MAQGTGRVGGVEHHRPDPFGGQSAGDPFEAVQLLAGEGIVGLVGHGQVGEQALQA